MAEETNTYESNFLSNPANDEKKAFKKWFQATTEAAFNTYLKENQQSDKHKAQMHLQMLLTGRKTGYFCVASPKFENNQKVKIVEVNFDERYCNSLIKSATYFWIQHFFPRLHRQKM